MGRTTIKRHDQYYVYILRCADGTYYTGYTSNLEKRVEAHNKKRGSKYCMAKLPVEMVYAKPYAYYKNAIKREREIKKLPRAKKETLVKSYQEIGAAEEETGIRA